MRHFCFSVMAAATLGCGVNSGFLHSTSSDQTVHTMAISSERYVRTVWGSSSIPSLLCALPMGSGLYFKAMNDFNKAAKLQPYEVLKNIRHDDDPLCFVIVGMRSLMISADVYAVTPVDGAPGAPPNPSPVVEAPAAPPPDLRREHECMDDNSCSTGYRCVSPSDGGKGTCRPAHHP